MIIPPHGLGESSFGFWVIRVDGNRGLPRWLQISSLVQLWISILVLAGYRFWGECLMAAVVPPVNSPQDAMAGDSVTSSQRRMEKD